MWICPNCQNQCETPFCPLCGYEKPNQISETDLLKGQLKQLRKKTKILNITVIVLGILIVALTVGCFFKFIELDSRAHMHEHNIYDLYDDIYNLRQKVYNEHAEVPAETVEVTQE